MRTEYRRLVATLWKKIFSTPWIVSRGRHQESGVVKKNETSTIGS